MKNGGQNKNALEDKTRISWKRPENRSSGSGRPEQIEKGKPMKFRKLTVIEPANISEETEKELRRMADTVELFQSIPEDEEEIIRRIGASDAVLLSYTSTITKEVLQRCPSVKYVGLCCSLYGPESANVDILYAKEHGITVTGINNYGEEGVVEFVLYEIIQLFHGYGKYSFEGYPREITGTKVGMIGLGSVGTKLARALQAMGAELFYFDFARKPEQEEAGIQFAPMEELLKQCTVVCTCMTKNKKAMFEQEFQWFGSHKVLFNTGLTPTFDRQAVETWLESGDNYLICDSDLALGDEDGSLIGMDRVSCKFKASGGTTQALERLNRKVLENLHAYLLF